MTWITNDRATAKQLWDVDNVLEAVYADILKHPTNGAKHLREAKKAHAKACKRIKTKRGSN
jgi:hypothetical protein